ncbi:MAG: hypothetical protein FWB95_09110 [Treponema sp.]|nr:hypothetical protein [Treponema sp.]
MAYEKRIIGDGLPHGKGKTYSDGSTEEGYFFQGEYAGKNEEAMAAATEKAKDQVF